MRYGSVEGVARLLEDPCVRATINVQDKDGNIALHRASQTFEKPAARKARLLLQSGADPLVTNNYGGTPLIMARHPAVIALLEQALAEAEKASLLVKARRLAAISRNIVAPSYLQDRVIQGQPLPQVQLVPVTGGNTRAMERERKHRSLMAFLLGMGGGPENTGMQRDVFRLVMDLLMPSWDPLRRNNAGVGPAALQG